MVKYLVSCSYENEVDRTLNANMNAVQKGYESVYGIALGLTDCCALKSRSTFMIASSISNFKFEPKTFAKFAKHEPNRYVQHSTENVTSCFN